MTILETIENKFGRDTIEVFGDSGTGKTTFALYLVKEALELGRPVYYIDTERNLVTVPDGVNYVYYTELSDILNYLRQMKERGIEKNSLIVLDSLGFPVLVRFATAPMNERGSMLLKAISIAGYLKYLTAVYDSTAIVTNQPESEFGKSVHPDFLHPFGDKSIYAFKEVWRTEAKKYKDRTEVSIWAWRSRFYPFRKVLFRMEISGSGPDVSVEVGL
ncbi:MAG TPA: hypothetical protein ENK81_03000 [Euryarchaeota archaeon]|nr:hypothetical protein [Euryarchaeota archaeon]